VRLTAGRWRQSYQELLRAENASNCGMEHVEEGIQGLFHAFSDLVLAGEEGPPKRIWFDL
jgi:hypothetical protein